jgi:hypothetical protein
MLSRYLDIASVKKTSLPVPIGRKYGFETLPFIRNCAYISFNGLLIDEIKRKRTNSLQPDCQIRRSRSGFGNPDGAELFGFDLFSQ